MTIKIALKRNDWVFHTGSSILLATCVVVHEPKSLDIPIWEFSIILEHLPFWHGYQQILRQLLVLRNLAVWMWYPWLLLPSFEMLMRLWSSGSSPASARFRGAPRGDHLSTRSEQSTPLFQRAHTRFPHHLCSDYDHGRQRSEREQQLFPALTLAWLYIEPSPCGEVRPAGDPVDSDPGAVFEDDPHPRSDAGRPLEPWVCHHTRDPTVLSRVSCRSFHWPFSPALPVTMAQPLTATETRQPAGQGEVRTVIPTYPCGQPGSPSFASHWRYCHADCVRSWIIFLKVASEYNSTFVFLVLWLQTGILQKQISISEAKWTFAPFVLASSITSDLLLNFDAGIFSSFSRSLSTAAFAAGIFMAWGIGKICVPKCHVVVNCHLFLRHGLHDEWAMILPYAVLWIHWLPRYTQILFWNDHSCFELLLSYLTCMSCKA